MISDLLGRTQNIMMFLRLSTAFSFVLGERVFLMRDRLAAEDSGTLS